MEGPSDWFEELRGKRTRWVAANIENDFERGIWNATVAKYADPTHFVFELLQNAEDEGATIAKFRLETHAIVFEHNGAPFQRKDVVGITGLGNTTKLEEANKIGCFGIGFKSVFVVTPAPEVHATVDGAPLAFAIRDLVVPERIQYAGADGLTRVVLPLSAEGAPGVLDAVRKQLRDVGPRAMLFLDSLSELSWSDTESAERYGAVTDAGGVRILSREVGPDREEQAYLVLSRSVERPDAKRALAVKIAFRMSAMRELVRETEPTKLSVFFETEEKTGLQFHLHGPFALTDNRANVKRDDPWNTELVAELANLLASSLGDLRDRGLVTRGFLGVLPNERDQLESPWTALRDAAVRTFKVEALTPAQFGGHAPATGMLRGPAELRDFLRDEGLSILHGTGPRRWSISVTQRNDREDNFLNLLGIPEWGWAEFSGALSGLGYSRQPAVVDWFEALDDDALRRFYLLLDSVMRSTRGTAHLTMLPIVKLETGQYVSPSRALLPPADDQDKDSLVASRLTLVSAAVLAGRSRKDVIDVLKRLGAHEVAEVDYIKALVDSHAHGGGELDRRHLAHMKHFVTWWSEHRDDEPFKGKVFVRAEGVAGYLSADRIFIDAPFADTGMAIINDGQTAGRDRLPLWTGYRRLKREALLGLLAACGAEQRLGLVTTELGWNHSLRSKFPNTRETNTRRAEDYAIQGLPELLERKDARISRLIWHTMAAAPQRCLLAVYTPNQSTLPLSEPSNVVAWLRHAAWIPAADGTLKHAADMTVKDLAPDLTATGSEAWLRAIGFGDAQRQLVEAGASRRKAAASLGLSAEVADRLGRMSPQDLEAANAAFLRRLQAGDAVPPAFPERSSRNPERRAERVAERAHTAEPKTYEIKERSVRTSDGDVRAQAKTWLRDLYTLSDGTMVCQCCHQRMPFNLSDGKPYFEAVACVADEARELVETFLALCPTCAAKWQVANGQTPAVIRALLFETAELSIEVSLAGHEAVLRFVEVHLLDLQTALRQSVAA